jgi:hypothetical protein
VVSSGGVTGKSLTSGVEVCAPENIHGNILLNILTNLSYLVYCGYLPIILATKFSDDIALN